MKSTSTFTLVSLALVFASCTSAYKSGQTPDDVYYSPARPQAEYVRQEKNDDQMYRYDDEAYRDDRYLRMKIRDPRYNGLYDDYYSYNPYYYHYYNGNLIYNSPWSSYSYWNYYYNPYCSHVITVVPKVPVYNKPRTFDLSVYTPQPTYNSNNPKANVRGSNTYSNQGYRPNNYQNSGRDAGSFLRDVFSGGNSGSSPSRSSTSSSSSSSSSSGSSSGSSSSSRGNATRGNH